jgi:ribonuclease R
MLPKALSSDACSLVPHEPRSVVTVEMDVAEDGHVRSSSFYRSLIRSDARLTYNEVELFLRGQRPAPEAVAEPLRQARSLAAAIRRRRLSRGALGLETSEPEFEFDSDGNVLKAIDAEQTESHNLIEELMILANEQVAETLARGRRPTLYRVHEPPEPSAIENLVAQLESLDVPTPPLPDHITPRTAADLVGTIASSVARHVEQVGRGRVALTSLVLRSLKQAYYSPTNVGHAGLASSAYTHFTSPIRRFPDLVVHRALLAAIGADDSPPPTGDLSEIGWHCSQTEREAMSLEHDADDICLAFLLEQVLVENGWDSSFEGEVTGLAPGGAFVSFETGEDRGAACEGFLPARRLRGEYFELNEEGTALVGRRTGKRLRLGDPVSVAVRSVEPVRGRVDLVPLSGQDETSEPRGRRGAAR